MSLFFLKGKNYLALIENWQFAVGCIWHLLGTGIWCLVVVVLTETFVS